MKLTELNKSLHEGIGTELLLGMLPKKIKDDIHNYFTKGKYKAAAKVFKDILRDNTRKISKHDAMIKAAHAVGLDDKDDIIYLDKLFKIAY